MSVDSRYHGPLRASLEEMLNSNKSERDFLNKLTAFLKLEIPLWQSDDFPTNDLAETIEQRKQMVTKIMFKVINSADDETEVVSAAKTLIENYGAYFDCKVIAAEAKKITLNKVYSIINRNKDICAYKQAMISSILENNEAQVWLMLFQNRGLKQDRHIIEIANKLQNSAGLMVTDRNNPLLERAPTPVDSTIREQLLEAIYTNDTALIQTLINQGYIPDLDCFLFATCVGHADSIAIINSSIVNNQLKSALLQDDPHALAKIIDSGVVINGVVLLYYLSLHKYELIEPLYQAAIKNNSSDQLINSLLIKAPELFHILPSFRLDLQSNFGYFLVSYCIRSGDLLNLNLLKDMNQSLESYKININDLRLYFRSASSNGVPNINDLLSLFGILKQLGWSLNSQLKEQILIRLSNLPEQEAASIKIAINQEKFQNFQTVDTIRPGHTLGLSNDILDLEKGDVAGKHAFTFEANTDFNSQNYLLENMAAYESKLTNEKRDKESLFFAEIKDSFQSSQNMYLGDGKLSWNASNQLMDRYLDNKLTTFPSGWTGHSVSIVLYKGYLIYTNRGEGGDLTNNTKIYKLKNNALLNEATITKLLSNRLYTREKLEFMKTLETLVDVSNPLATLPSKAQKHGNCSYANKLSSIEAMLCLLQVNDINPNFTDEQIQAVVQSNIAQRDNGLYKKFTRFARNHEINLIINQLPDVVGNHYLMEHYFGIVKEIIAQHHGESLSDVKNRNELKHVKQLVEALPVPYRERLLSEWPIIETLITKADANKRSKPMLMSTNSVTSVAVAPTLNSQSIDPVEIKPTTESDNNRRPCKS